MTVCKRVRYSGRVQGVGFRYTAERLAEGHPVTGFVRNLPNGDVELVAEGEAEQVQAFLKAVTRQMGNYIRHVTVQEESPEGYEEFRITY